MATLSLLVFSLLAFLILFVLQYLWVHRRFYRLALKIPSPSGSSKLTGFLTQFFGADNKKLFYLIKWITSPGPTSPTRVFEGPRVWVFFHEPEQVRKILSSRQYIDRAETLIESLGVFPKGIFMINGDAWRQHRKLLDPSFSASVLKSFLPIFNDKSRICMEILAEKANGTEFDMYEALTPLSLDTILATSLGLKESLQTSDTHTYVDDCVISMNVVATKILKFWLKFRLIWKWTEEYRLQTEHVDNGMNLIGSEILKIKEMQYKKGTVDKGDLDYNKPQIFIDQLYKMRDVYDIETIRDEINTMIFAGFETVSNTLSLTLLLIAMHPRVQNKLFDELQQVFQSKSEEVTEEKIESCVYLDLVVKEAMRVWPSIPFLVRTLNEEVDFGNCIVPGGVTAVLPFYHIHRSKKIWGEDAEEFRPERFEPEEFSKIPLYAYNPFSRGPRICIGHKYAMNSMKTTLTYFLRQYKVATTLKMDAVEFEFALLMKVSGGSMVSIEKRT